MSAKALQCLFAIAFVLAMIPGRARAQDPVDLPEVEVVGTAITTEGDPVFCFTASCYQIIQFETASFDGTFAQLSQEGDDRIDKDNFCANLAGNQPPGCSYSSPPSVPGFDPGWVGNGCGNGSFATIFANELISHFGSGYEADLDHPFPGVSFYPACQMHDGCYATGGKAKIDCDTHFEKNLNLICGKASVTYQSSCLQLGAIYVEAVEDFGNASYNAAQADYACAAWVSEMEVNKCTPPR